MEIKRYLGDDRFENFKKDFNFLFRIIKNSSGEYDLRLRDNYFNLYYKGNSLAKVTCQEKKYRIEIHNKFVQSMKTDLERFSDNLKEGKNYCTYDIEPKKLHQFLQVKHLNKICSNIKEVNYGEEIVFEQMLITDNSERDDLFIIDRQITETTMKGQKMDLLALRQIKDNKYSFVVIEVKLGNNKELKEKVALQIQRYTDHINSNLKSWKECYERNYRQIKQTGIFDKPRYPSIEILNNAIGLVVVGGYSRVAQKYIHELNGKYPKIKVISMKNKINI